MSGRNKNIPSLRFSQFDEAWNRVVLGDIASFQKGKGISKTDLDESGKLECIRYGELYTIYNELIEIIVSKTNLYAKDLILSEHNDVIIPASGETQIDIATASCVLKSGVALGGDLNIIRSPMNGIFMAFYLNNKKKFDIAQLAQGASVVHLYSSQLKTLILNLPSLPEQQKIASFLSAIDEKIRQLMRKKELLEQYKKGVMQQLFSAKLRFKDNGKAYPRWEERRLGDVCHFFSGGTPKSTIKKFYAGNIPFIGSGNIYDSEVSSFISKEALNSSSAKLVNKGDLLFALYGANSGEVAVSKINGAINQAVLCIRSTENIKYIYQVLLFNKDSIVSRYLQGGQGNLSANIVKQLKFRFPSHREQEKIVSFLSSIDTKIESVSNQITRTQLFKKGLLQQMFV